MANASSTAPTIEYPKPNGLEGVVAASTALSHVFGEEGRLVYRGYDIHELAGHASFEEVAFLLWIGHLPNEQELAEFNEKMATHRYLPQAVIDGLRVIPADAAPMDALRTGVSLLGAVLPEVYDETPDQDEAIALAASIPGIL
ncbi:MAG TPA: citrate/2-methylcitrate synthase, partial [Thermomicrobiales bacterium]|nr:citrate/2-methylcitrate synthase [Thermomicrobiales bacterium]